MCCLFLGLGPRLNCYPTAQMCPHWPGWCRRMASCWSKLCWRWGTPPLTFTPKRSPNACGCIVARHTFFLSVIVIKTLLLCFLPAFSRASVVGRLGTWWSRLQKCFSVWTSTAILCSLCGWRRHCSLPASRHHGSQLCRKTTSHSRYSGNACQLNSPTFLSQSHDSRFLTACICPPYCPVSLTENEWTRGGWRR